MDCRPNCIAEQNAKFQELRHIETMGRLDKMTLNQEHTIRLLSDLNNLSRNFDEFKSDSKQRHDEIFLRLRKLEIEKISRDEIVKFMTILGIGFAILQILFKWVIP